MRAMRSIIVVAALSLAACRAAPACPTTPATAAKSGKLEMREYVFVLLRRGPAWTPDKTPETEALFEGHMANIEAMAATGKLLIAGPFGAPTTDPTAIAGIFIFDSTSIDEVTPLLANDPAIAAGRLVAETTIWYGPAKITYPGIVVPPQ